MEQYRWPDNRHALDYRATAMHLRELRLNFEDIGVIDSRRKQVEFVDNAEAILGWGGIRQLDKLNEWRSLPPKRLHALIEDIRARLNPRTADTDDLRGFRYMGSGFSKVYSVLIDGFPIYDSRVACALNCGELEQVGFEPVDALQHALFMVGYAKLPDSAVPAA